MLVSTLVRQQASCLRALTTARPTLLKTQRASTAVSLRTLAYRIGHMGQLACNNGQQSLGKGLGRGEGLLCVAQVTPGGLYCQAFSGVVAAPVLQGHLPWQECCRTSVSV